MLESIDPVSILIGFGIMFVFWALTNFVKKKNKGGKKTLKDIRIAIHESGIDILEADTKLKEAYKKIYALQEAFKEIGE